VLTGSTAQIAAAFAGLAAELGEPFISRFLPGEIARLLHRHDFSEITDFGPDEARATYFPGQDDVEIAGAQRLVAATLAPASALNCGLLSLAGDGNAVAIRAGSAASSTPEPQVTQVSSGL
jgi:hypothetical protein